MSADLNRRVAEAQGWESRGDLQDGYWVNQNGEPQDFKWHYTPATDLNQAVAAAEALLYPRNLYFSLRQAWFAGQPLIRYEAMIFAMDGGAWPTHTELHNVPAEALCLAVLKALEGKDE